MVDRGWDDTTDGRGWDDTTDDRGWGDAANRDRPPPAGTPAVARLREPGP